MDDGYLLVISRVIPFSLSSVEGRRESVSACKDLTIFGGLGVGGISP